MKASKEYTSWIELASAILKQAYKDILHSPYLHQEYKESDNMLLPQEMILLFLCTDTQPLR